MVISASLQACGVVFPLAMPTSICRSIVTICSGLYLLFGMTRFPPSGFSLIPLGTNFPVTSHIEGTPLPGEAGNSGIAGHRDTFFRALRNIRNNDEIQF